MVIHHLPESNDDNRQYTIDTKIADRLASKEKDIVQRVNMVLDAHNERNFEGFVMTSVDGISGIDILALSYVAQLQLEFDPLIRGTSAEIFLRIYYNDIFRKLVQGRGLVNRARELFDQEKDNLVVADKINQEYAGKILKDLKLVKKDFVTTQDKIVDRLKGGFINIDNREEKTWLALQSIFGPQDKNSFEESATASKEKVEVITDPRLLSEIKKNNFNWFNFGKEKIDPVELSNLVYVMRALFRNINQKESVRYENIVLDGYVRQIIDVYLHAYNIYLRENLDLEERWFSGAEKIVRYGDGTAQLIEQRTDKDNFRLYQSELLSIMDSVKSLSEKYEQELKKSDLPAQAIVGFLGQNISKKVHWSKDSRLNKLVIALSDGLQFGDLKKYLTMTEEIFQERKMFLQNNTEEISKKLDRMERLAKDAIVRKKFFDLKKGQIKVDYFLVSYNSVVNDSDLQSLETMKILASFKYRVNSLFLSYIKDTLDYIISLDQLPDYQESQVENIARDIDGMLSKTVDASFVDRAGIKKIINEVNILCRMVRLEQLPVNNNISILPTATVEFQKTLIKYIDEYQMEMDRINRILSHNMV